MFSYVGEMSYFNWINRWFKVPLSTNESTDTPHTSAPDSGVTPETDTDPRVSLYRRIGGVVLVVVGWLLSPLCWWNDIVFNLPLAIGFGYLFSRIYPDAFVPLTVVGYWLSNVVGFVMMQQGAMAALKLGEQPQNPRKAFINGIWTSTAYTLVIVVLLQFHILDTPDIFSGDLWDQLNTLLPG